ncbi:unnamed protein product [Lampetra planeri]
MYGTSGERCTARAGRDVRHERGEMYGTSGGSGAAFDASAGFAEERAVPRPVESRVAELREVVWDRDAVPRGPPLSQGSVDLNHGGLSTRLETLDQKQRGRFVSSKQSAIG